MGCRPVPSMKSADVGLGETGLLDLRAQDESILIEGKCDLPNGIECRRS